MKLKLYNTILLFGVLLIFSSYKHPIKLTASLIEYNTETSSISVKCRVFIDDFERSINKTLLKDINVSNLTKEDKAGIENYFEMFYYITIKGKKLPFKYKTSKVYEEYNVLDIEFSENVMTIKKGDQLLIENTLFFEEFRHLQSNRITLNIPPFISEDNLVTTLSNSSISYTF